MKIWIPVGLALLLSVPVMAAVNDAEKPKTVLTVNLDDGSRLIGTTPSTHLPFRSEALGKLEIPLGKIRTAKFSKDHESVTLTLANGDILQGGLGEWALPLQTSFADVKVPVEHITTLLVRETGTTLPGLVLHYDFAAGKPATAELRNVEIADDTERGSVARFAGEGSFVSFPDKELPAGNAARTVALWVKTEVTPRRQVLFLYGRYQPGDEMHLLLYENSQVVTLGNWGGSGEFRGQMPVADGRWHHLALVYDGAGTAKVYVDGQLDVTAQRTYQTTTGGTGYLSFDYAGHGFLGSLDDFMVFDRALSAEEVVALSQHLK